jgi:glycosidase
MTRPWSTATLVLLALLAWAPRAQAAEACRANPLGTRLLYVRGSFNAWSAKDEAALRWSCDHFEGVVAIEGPTRFKIGDEAWSADADFGAGADATHLAIKGAELTHDFHGTHRIKLAMAKDDPTHPSLAIEDCPLTMGAGDKTVFLRGERNNFAALDAYAFQYSCDAYYLNVDLQGRMKFKLADAGWRKESTWGGQGETLLHDNAPANLSRGDRVDPLGDLSFDFHGEHTLRFAFPGGRPQLSIGPKSFADPREQAVDDPVALSLRHDSRALADRAPFGAVPAGTEVEFALHAKTGVESATLVLESRRLEGNQDLLEYTEVARVPMQAMREGEGSVFRARHRFADQGVQGYWFLVRIGGKDYAYQNNRDPIPWTREKGSNGVGAVEELPAPAPSAQAGPHSAFPFVRRYRLTVFDPAFAVPDWARDAIYYYIFPDRFRNGDPSNDAKPGVDKYHEATVEKHDNWNDKPWKPGDGSDQYYNNDFFGGDLAGIIEKLDYIHDLGANTIYMTPVFMASSNHKYDTADYRRIDPRFGTEAEFERLCAEAAKRGIRILPDASLNHVGQDSLYFDRFGNYGGTGAFANGHVNPASPYADWFHFDASQATPDKQYTGWVGIPDLPELDKHSPSFRRFAYGDKDSVMLHWLDRGADGWRMDVAPWVPDDFWREWRAAIKAHRPDAITVSETWFDASKFLVGDMFDSTMNYIFRNSVLDYANGGDARASYRNLELLRENYPPQSLHVLMNLLSTHDTARSLHLFGYDDGEADAAKVALGKQRLRLAIFFQFTYPGSPAIFYGDEVGLTGGDDPFNRGTYRWRRCGASIRCSATVRWTRRCSSTSTWSCCCGAMAAPGRSPRSTIPRRRKASACSCQRVRRASSAMAWAMRACSPMHRARSGSRCRRCRASRCSTTPRRRCAEGVARSPGQEATDQRQNEHHQQDGVHDQQPEQVAEEVGRLVHAAHAPHRGQAQEQQQRQEQSRDRRTRGQPHHREQHATFDQKCREEKTHAPDRIGLGTRLVQDMDQVAVGLEAAADDERRAHDGEEAEAQGPGFRRGCGFHGVWHSTRPGTTLRAVRPRRGRSGENSCRRRRRWCR